MSLNETPAYTSSWFDAPSQAHEATGYWGPSTANHQFCEPHYHVTHYIAEFYNTLSSLCYTAVALYMLYQEPKRLAQDPYVLATILSLAAIGLGSVAFHGTMRYDMELCDELPMVFFASCLVLGTISRPNRHPWVPNQTAASLWISATITMGLTVVATYAVYEKYEVFLHGFAAILILLFAINIFAPVHATMAEQHLFCRNMSLILLLVGKMFWQIEVLMCSSVPEVYLLHVVWHGFSCGAAYYGTLGLYFTRMAGDEAKFPSTLPNVWGLPPLKSSIKTKQC
jgi:dihydroceramidase